MKPSLILLTLITLAGCGQAPTIAPATATFRPVAAQAAAPTVSARRQATPVQAPAPVVAPVAAAPRLTAEDQGVVLDVLTYNTWGKPGLLGTDEKRRMRLIGPAIQGYDIVALQETFTRHAGAMGQLSAYEHQNWVKNGGWFKMKAGLFTLSKHRITETDFAAFEEAKTWDRFARKGVSFNRIEVAGIGPVDVYNTHYQAVAKYSEIRKHDNSVLEALVRKHDQGHPTLLLGDFNMKPGTPEHQDLMARLSPRDAFAERHPGEDGFTSGPTNDHKADDKAGKRIDYVFLLPNDRFEIAVEEAEVVMDEGEHLSDHFGVRARLRVSPKR